MDGEVGPEDLCASSVQATFKPATLCDTKAKAELLFEDLKCQGLLESRVVKGGAGQNPSPSGHDYTFADRAAQAGDCAFRISQE